MPQASRAHASAASPEPGPLHGPVPKFGRRAEVAAGGGIAAAAAACAAAAAAARPSVTPSAVVLLAPAAQSSIRPAAVASAAGQSRNRHRLAWHGGGANAARCRGLDILSSSPQNWPLAVHTQGGTDEQKRMSEHWGREGLKVKAQRSGAPGGWLRVHPPAAAASSCPHAGRCHAERGAAARQPQHLVGR